jgi:hypothetical protein
MTFLKTVSNYGKTDPIEITEDMYLHGENGKRCAFGWASEEWGHEEIYAMDPRNGKWAGFITSFYKNASAYTRDLFELGFGKDKTGL